MIRRIATALAKYAGLKTLDEASVEDLAGAAGARGFELSGTKSSFLISGASGSAPSLVGRFLTSNYSDDIQKAADQWYFPSHLVSRPTLQLGMCLAQIDWVPQIYRDGRWHDIPVSEADEVGPGAELAKLVYDPSFAANVLVTQMHNNLCGNGVIHKVRRSGVRHPGAKGYRILELKVVVPRLEGRIKKSPGGQLAYTFTDGGAGFETTVELLRSEFIHFKTPNPVRPEWGASLIGAVGDQIESDEKAISWQSKTFDNRITPDGVFKTDLHPDDDTYRALKEQIREQQTHPHEPLLLMGGTDYESLAQNAVDLDWRQGREQIRNDILSASGMPPVMAGYFDQATLSNADSSRKIFWEEIILPIASNFARALATDLIPHFGSSNKYRVHPSFARVPAMRHQMESKAKTLYTLRASGVPYAEAAVLLDLPVTGEQEAPPAALVARENMSNRNEQQQDQAVRGEGPLDRSTPNAGPKVEDEDQ